MNQITRRRLLLAAPLGVVGAGGVTAWLMLRRMPDGRFDPHDVGTPAVGREVPAFSLPGPDHGTAGFDAESLRGQTGPVLVNFFASWCVPCLAEAASLKALSAQVPVWGIAYKDPDAALSAFVARTGDPYARLASDAAGTTAIDWGVTGVPESFLVAPGGRIVWHKAGGLDVRIIADELLPALHGIAPA